MVTVNGLFNISIDAHGFKEVLEDFQSAKSIFIVTYNISKERKELIELLSSLSENTQVTIITNIPGRFENYIEPNVSWRGKTPKQRAKESIEKCLHTLDSKNFNCELSTYFNFKNHAKIVFTENIGYIGSANFSDESRNSFEAGVILKDKNQLQSIMSEIKEVLIPSSFRSSTNLSVIFTELASEWISEAKNSMEAIDRGLFTYAEIGYFRIEKILDYHNANISKELLEQIDIIYYHCEETCNDIININGFDPKHQRNIKRFLKLYKLKVKHFNNNLSELANFDRDKFIMKHAQTLDEYYSGDPEDLEKALEIAQTAAQEKHEDIIIKFNNQKDVIEKNVRIIPRILQSIINIINESNQLLKRKMVYENQKKIDNTQ